MEMDCRVKTEEGRNICRDHGCHCMQDRLGPGNFARLSRATGWSKANPTQGWSPSHISRILGGSRELANYKLYVAICKYAPCTREELDKWLDEVRKKWLEEN